MKQIKRDARAGRASGKWRRSIENDAKVFKGCVCVCVGGGLYNSKMAALNGRVVCI